MDKKQKILTGVGAITALFLHLQDVNAHLEPKDNEATEKCYGVAKAGQNDCASKANNHACAGLAKIDNDPNEWVKLPKGECEKLPNGSLQPKG